MKWFIAVLLAGCAAPAGAGADDVRNAEMRKLEGDWKIQSIDIGGQKQEAGGGAPDRVMIKDGKATFFAVGKEIPTFRDLRLDLNPAKQPKAMDLVRQD